MLPVADLTEKKYQMSIACPLYDKRSGNCQLSTTVQPFRRPLCQTDEHDACPVYLGYLLRRTRMTRCDNDWLDACS